MIDQTNGHAPIPVPAEEPAAVPRPADDQRRVVVALTERQRERMAVYVQQAEAARQRAVDALTDILLGKDVDLSQFEAWSLSPDGRAAVLTPRAWPAAGAPERSA